MLTVSEGVLAVGNRIHLGRRCTREIDKRDNHAGSEPDAHLIADPMQLTQLSQLFATSEAGQSSHLDKCKFTSDGW